MAKDFLYPLRRLHGMMHDAQRENNVIRQVRHRVAASGKRTVIFVLTPTHGNMGDHAIASAVIRMLRELEIDYVEVTAAELTLMRKHHRLGVLDKRPILVNGGGNIGTLWPGVEKTFRSLIRSCSNSRIICLPNTAFFEDSSQGRMERRKSAEIYKRHGALKICAREHVSYDLLKEIHSDVTLIPDMVLSLDKSGTPAKRSGCVLCLRTDLERTRTDAEENMVREQASRIFGDCVSESDMNIRRNVSIDQREKELQNKYDVFRNAELVITDRLHGMIFAAITGTPCVVLNSKSHKVRGCFEWLKDLPYIRFAESAEQISDVFASIPKEEFRYDNSHLGDYFRELQTYLIELVQ